jgi:hypothetical protein
MKLLYKLRYKITVFRVIQLLRSYEDIFKYDRRFKKMFVPGFAEKYAEFICSDSITIPVYDGDLGTTNNVTYSIDSKKRKFRLLVPLWIDKMFENELVVVDFVEYK